MVPTSVRNVVASVLSEESFSVKWDPPANYNGPAGPTKLHIWTPNGMEKEENVTHSSSSSSSKTFEGLKSSVPYYVSLMASTAEEEGTCRGQDGESLLAGLVYLESKDHPIPPPDVRLTVLAATALRAEWTQKESVDPEILAYTYKLTVNSSGSLAQIGYLPATARSLVLNNLAPVTKYNLEISANGIYTHGIAHESATTAPGVPGSVQNLTVEKKSDSSIEAKWEEPLKAPGTVSSYRCVLYSGSLPAEWQTVRTTSVTFKELDKSNSYRVGVSAIIDPINQNIGGGMGPESMSDFVHLSGEEAAPELGPPVDLNATADGPFVIALSWKPPAPANVPVYFYKITITEDGGLSRTEVASGSSTFRLLVGLKPNTGYNIVMKSIGLQTESPDTQPVSAKTTVGVPSAPLRVTAKVVNSTEAQVSWREPASTGSGVTGYNVTVRRGGTELDYQEVDNSTTCVFSALPEFAELVFVVAAKSDIGIGESALSNPIYTQAKAEAPTVAKIVHSAHQFLKTGRPFGVKDGVRPTHSCKLSFLKGTSV
nr:unnamed protein product [Spirometra erinaceieuropaei]